MDNNVHYINLSYDETMELMVDSGVAALFPWSPVEDCFEVMDRTETGARNAGKSAERYMGDILMGFVTRGGVPDDGFQDRHLTGLRDGDWPDSDTEDRYGPCESRVDEDGEYSHTPSLYD